MTPLRIKICGVTNVKDARACAELGADMIGFNFYPKSPRHIEPEIARQIVETLPRSARAVGVFVEASTDEIRNTAKRAGIESVQLHGDFSPEPSGNLLGEFGVIRPFRPGAGFHREEAAASRDV